MNMEIDMDDHVNNKEFRKTMPKKCSTLYSICLQYVSKNMHCFLEQVEKMPFSQIIDVFEKSYELRLSGNLQCLLSNLPLLERIIRHPCNWKTIHRCLHLVLAQEKDFDYFLANQKVTECQRLKDSSDNISTNKYHKQITKFIREAIVLGSFFAEHGLYTCARMVFGCIDTSELNGNVHPTMLTIAFEIGLRIAHVSTVDCDFVAANKSIFNSSILLNYLQNSGLRPNCALFYTTCSMYMFSLSQYDKAFNLAVQAVQEISCDLNPKVIVDTLRQACKVCIIKRIFAQAHVYINEALKLSKHWFGVSHPKYADCLADYAFYLISVDSVTSSVKFYEMALKIRQNLFSDDSVITSMTHEDLAYAIYVRDYSNGNFEEARHHAELALKVMIELLPEDHLMLSSVKRVQALILEEIALESNSNVTETRLLGCAEKLHLDSLRLARKTFGESNVQTAKHYGNLGRLYQSMKKYKKAEGNHLKAIEIKENLLGKEHYEVALSIGHLASLYNYDMKKYDLAEQLYLRSIAIGRKLFGVWYSGLEYDYRGLVHLYDSTERFEDMSTYQLQLSDWEEERRNKVFKQPTQLNIDMDSDVTIKSVLSNIKKHASYGAGSSGSSSG